MESGPNLSIIIVTKDDSEGLRNTLKSISGLIGLKYEVIVVEGSSSQQANLILSELEFERKIFLPGPDLGIYDGMNKGIKSSSGEVLWFLNGGDTAINLREIPNQIFKLINSPKLWLQCQQKNISHKRYYSKKLSHYFIEYLLWHGIRPIPHQSSFFKKEFFDRVNLYSTDIGVWADQEKYLRAMYQNIRPIKSYLNTSIHLPGGLGDLQKYGTLFEQIQNFHISKNLSNKSEYRLTYAAKIIRKIQIVIYCLSKLGFRAFLDIFSLRTNRRVK